MTLKKQKQAHATPLGGSYAVVRRTPVRHLIPANFGTTPKRGHRSVIVVARRAIVGDELDNHVGMGDL